MPDQFAIVELMGHRRFGARVTEVERFGAKCMRAEILTDGEPVEQLVYPGSIYAVTMCTEEQARKVNTRWSLQSAVPMLPAEVAPVEPIDADPEDNDEPYNDEPIDDPRDLDLDDEGPDAIESDPVTP